MGASNSITALAPLFLFIGNQTLPDTPGPLIPITMSQASLSVLRRFSRIGKPELLTRFAFQDGAGTFGRSAVSRTAWTLDAEPNKPVRQAVGREHEICSGTYAALAPE